MATEKITKKVYFEMLKDIVTATDTVDKDNLLAFIDTNIAQLDAKAAKAKEKAAEKKVEGDELREKIAACLTTEPKDIATILDEVGDEELTRAKVTARLAQLINLGTVTKEVTKTADGKKATVYKLAE